MGEIVISLGCEISPQFLSRLLGALPNRRSLSLRSCVKIGMRGFANYWIGGMLKGYGAGTGLMRAAMVYAQQHPRAFVRRQRALRIQNFRIMVHTFLLWRDEIRHPDPESAVGYGMMMVAFTARELILFNQAEAFAGLIPLSNEHLHQELCRAFLRYLGTDAD